MRHILDAALARSSVKLAPAVVSGSFEFLRAHMRAEPLVTFQIPIGPPHGAQELGSVDGLCVRPLDPRDARPGLLHVCKLRGRTLSVAAARFSDQVVEGSGGLTDDRRAWALRTAPDLGTALRSD